ncbi:MAG TPA: hypothetical protein VHI52_05935, partial [Verrucomicrobiae bacterium]|nr:hypothetical protein [Verrucomicrobiae bacterium]
MQIMGIDYEGYTHLAAHNAQVSALNNLFYNCLLHLTPVPTEVNNWTFTDNIFDNSAFVNDGGVQN